MITENNERRLKNMVGKQYIYMFKHHRVLRYEVRRELKEGEMHALLIITDKDILGFDNQGFSKAYNDFLFVDESESDHLPADPSEYENAVALPSREVVSVGVNSSDKKEVAIVGKGIEMPTTLLSTHAQKLADVLLDNITKVQEGSEYIPQAQAIAESTKTFLELAKAEITLILAVNKVSK